MPRIFKRVLITGIEGSGGSYLAEYITQNHPEVGVHGIARWHSTTQNNLVNVSNVVVHECDLLDFGSILNVLRKVEPDVIFHLAAHANVRTSFITPQTVLANNILGTCNLFEAIRSAQIDPYIQLCSTSEVYGQVLKEEVPIKETAPLRPVSPYAVSKVAQDLLGGSYFASYGMKIIRTRMFAYLNPRRADLFATSFARQIVLIERGKQGELWHGNLDSTRTLLDVRDAMRAYWEATLYCQPGEIYNIGGTTVMKVGEFLNRLSELSIVPILARVDPALLRPADVTLQIPNTDKFTKTTGWQPTHSFEDSLDFLLTYWRSALSR